MSKMWAGRFAEELNKEADDFNSSISVVRRMFRQDITGSVVHANMLVKQGIIPKEDGDKIVSGLSEILSDIEDGKLSIDLSCEDIHMFIEGELLGELDLMDARVYEMREAVSAAASDDFSARVWAMDNRKLFNHSRKDLNNKINLF